MYRNDPTQQLIWQTRRLFQALNSESNEWLSGFEITTAQRAVLEFLDHKEPETLANIARDHDVSRQHIQQLVNDLLAKGYVETLDNPAHKRSFLVRRTRRGKQVFKKIQSLEARALEKLGGAFDDKQLTQAAALLQQIHTYLHSEEWSKIRQSFASKEK